MPFAEIYYQSGDFNKDGIFSGWRVKGVPGVVASYTDAIALNMGLWEEYCTYHRNTLNDEWVSEMLKRRKPSRPKYKPAYNWLGVA